MRAIAFSQFGGPEVLQPLALPRPRPEKGEILIRVVAAGVNPVDCKIREGLLQSHLPHRFPVIPGWDAAGVVEELGEDAGRFRKGDRVWAFTRKLPLHSGCCAEYVAAAEEHVALMPAKLLFEEAASVPLAALTAHQCLRAGPKIGAESSVLVHAAAGGVGHFAVQLARLAGARVLGTASPENHSFVLGLGAAAAIDYKNEDVGEAFRRHCPEGADLVIDTVGGDALDVSYGLLRSGGRLVSIVSEPDPESAREHGATAGFLSAEPNAEQLAELGRLFDRKKLRTKVQKIYPLSQAAEAHRVQEDGHVQGKLVMNL